MPPLTGPGSPADWLRHAHSDLALAQSSVHPDVLYETLCFHAQQAAEKSLKAVLIARGIVPPRSHNIRTLLDLLEDNILIPDALAEVAVLTDYAVMSRYPAWSEPVGVEDWREAVRLAEYAMMWAEEQLKSKS